MNIEEVVFAGDLWIAVPIALLAGLISFVSPCVLPLVPGYLGFIGGAVSGGEPRVAAAARGGAAPMSTATAPDASAPTPAATKTAVGEITGVTRARLLGGVLLFIAGFTTVFFAINIIGSAFGTFFLSQGELLTRIGGAIVIVLGFVFLGFFGVAQRTMKPQFKGRAGLVGAYILGFTLGVGWTPCIGPTLGVIMTLSWSGGVARGIVLALAYSIGLGLPFVLIALGFGWAARSVAFVRRHLRVINIIGGSFLIALGVLMVTGLWWTIMSQLAGVMRSVPLPL